MRRPAALAAAAAIGLLLSPVPAHGADWTAVVQRHAPAIVNLKITVRAESEHGGEPEETTQEAQGALVDPAGLVMVWNSHFSANRFLDLLAQMGGGEFKMKVTPTDIRVNLDGGETELAAFLAAADTDLDLAFIQLEEPPARPLPAIDFADAATVRAGDELAAVSRLSSAFDRVPYFDVVRVGGEIRRPRPAWIVTGGNATRLGLPYFAADGRPAGVLVTVMSKTRNDALSGSSNLMADLLSLGRGEVEVGPLGVFLLPAERVRSVIEQARRRAAELLAERKRSESQPPAPGGAR